MDGLVRVLFLPRFPTKLADNVTLLALAPQNVLVRYEALESDRPTCVDPPRADAHLGTKAIAESVGEARARVDEHAGRVDAAHERAGRLGVLSYDAVRVVRAVRVDVRDGCGQGRYGAHGECEREVLGHVGFWRGGTHVCGRC